MLAAWLGTQASCVLPVFTRLGSLVLVQRASSPTAVWLALAYRVEFRGESRFLALWLASLAFFAANVAILVALVRRAVDVVDDDAATPLKATKATTTR